MIAVGLMIMNTVSNMEFFATIIATEEQKVDFEKDLSRNGIFIKVVTPDSDEYHYSLEGDRGCYDDLMKIANRSGDGQYKITSLEHFAK